MKKIMILVVILLSFSQLRAEELLKIGEIQNGIPILTYDHNKIITGLEDMCNDGTEIDNVEIEENNGTYILNGTGEKNENFIIVGIYCILQSNALFVHKYGIKIVELHSCEGFQCSSCTFQKDGTGTITGCQCNNPVNTTGYCNHSVRQIPIQIK